MWRRYGTLGEPPGPESGCSNAGAPVKQAKLLAIVHTFGVIC
jgi:hypothetical protein